MGYCVALGCKSNNRKLRIQNHRFPFKRPEMLRLWVAAVRRKNWIPNRSSRLCSQHFTENDYTIPKNGTAKKQLKFDAVPTIFNFPKGSKKCTVNSRVLKYLKKNQSDVTPIVKEDTDDVEIGYTLEGLSHPNELNIADAASKNYPSTIIGKTELPKVTNINPTNMSSAYSESGNGISINISPKLLESTNISNLPSNQYTVTITKDNFQNICRCCVVNRGEVKLFEDNCENKSLADMIYFCTKEKIFATDDLPESVCNVCFQQIMNTFSFVKKFKEGQVHIRELQILFSGRTDNFGYDDNDIIKSDDFSPDEQVLHARKPTIAESFRHEYRGLTKIYNQLCRVLLENKRQINKPIVSNARSSKFDEMPSEEVNEKFNQTMEESISNGQTNVNIVNINNESLSNCENNLFLEDNVAVSNLIRLENNGTSYIETCQDRKLENHNDRVVTGDETTAQDVQKKYVNNENGKQIAPCLEGKTVVISESYKEAIGDELLHVDMYTLPDNILEENFEKILNSDFDDIKMNEDGQVSLVEAEEYTQCFECSQTFMMERDFIRHCRVTGHVMADRFKCSLCSATFDLQRMYKAHLRKHNYTKCICEICGAMITPKNLYRHMEIHNGSKRNICQYCGKGFTQKGSLHDHLQRKHLDVPLKSLCFLCGKSFKTSYLLDMHLNNDHKDEDLANKSYKCEMCGRYFASLTSRKIHEKNSHGDQPVCRPRYKKGIINQRIIVKQRVKSFHKKCPVCFKNVNPCGFKMHMLSHENLRPHKCEICSRKFLQPSHLKMHMNAHLKKKLYKCENCQKCFRNALNFKTHVRSHTGEYPYTCPICDQGFTNLTLMKIHRKIHLKGSRNARNQKEFKGTNKTDEEECHSDREFRDSESEKSDNSDSS